MKACRYPWISPIIAYNGDVGVCCNDIHFLLKLGNIKESSLKEIWLSPNAEQLRYLHITNQLDQTPDKICLKCRKEREIPTMLTEWILDYLRTINREDLIDFYLNRIRDTYPLEFQYKKKEDQYKINQEYPLFPNLIKEKHFRYKTKNNAYLGSDHSLTFYPQIPKNILSLNLRFHASGIKAPVAFETFLDNKPLGEKTARKIGGGSGEIIEYTINDNLKDLAEKDIVKLEIKVKKGSLALFEKSKIFQNIQLTCWKNKPMPHKEEKNIHTYKAESPYILGNSKTYTLKDHQYLELQKGSVANYFIKIQKESRFTRLFLETAGIEKEAEFKVKVGDTVFTRKVRKIGGGCGERFEFIIDKPLKNPSILSIDQKDTLAIFQKSTKGAKGIEVESYEFKPMQHEIKENIHEYDIYSPLTKGESFQYNNEDNFNKGYKFLALKENTEITYYIDIIKPNPTIKLNLAGIGSTAEAEINSQIITAPQLGSGFGRIITIQLKAEKGTFELKIKAKRGALAILQEPSQPTLEKTPIKILF